MNRLDLIEMSAMEHYRHAVLPAGSERLRPWPAIAYFWSEHSESFVRDTRRHIADTVTVQGVLLNPVCQEELYHPGRNVPINPDYNPILTPQRPVPDVRLGYAST